MTETTLSLVAMHRIIEKDGAERVSESACEELARVLEEVGLKIGIGAIDFTMHASRRMVKGIDRSNI